MPLSKAIKAVQAAVQQADRAWFAAHPHARHYARPYVPGELPHDADPYTAQHAVLTLVTQLAPGVRVRRFIVGPAVPDGDNLVWTFGPDDEVYDILHTAKGA
jgi:hypothetical protein